MNKLFFDIETLPAEEEKRKILKEIHRKKIEDGKKRSPAFEEFKVAVKFYPIGLSQSIIKKLSLRKNVRMISVCK